VLETGYGGEYLDLREGYVRELGRSTYRILQFALFAR
jgi:hypothetical protein